MYGAVYILYTQLNIIASTIYVDKYGRRNAQHAVAFDSFTNLPGRISCSINIANAVELFFFVVFKPRKYALVDFINRKS